MDKTAMRKDKKISTQKHIRRKSGILQGNWNLELMAYRRGRHVLQFMLFKKHNTSNGSIQNLEL